MKNIYIIILIISNIIYSQKTREIDFNKLNYKIIELSKTEISLDSLYQSVFISNTQDLNQESKSFKLKKLLHREYKSNLARDFKKKMVNDCLIPLKNKVYKWESRSCQCSLANDNTIEIKLGFDFLRLWDGDGHIINIENNKFRSYYQEYKHEHEIYKESEIETDYKSLIKVNYQFAKLTLNDSLNFKHNDIIQGSFDYNTQPFYIKNWISNEKISLNGIVHFKCRLKDLKKLKL